MGERLLLDWIILQRGNITPRDAENPILVETHLTDAAFSRVNLAAMGASLAADYLPGQGF